MKKPSTLTSYPVPQVPEKLECGTFLHQDCIFPSFFFLFRVALFSLFLGLFQGIFSWLDLNVLGNRGIASWH